MIYNFYYSMMAPIAKMHHYEHYYGPSKYNGKYWIVSRELPLTPVPLAVIEGVVYEAFKRKRALNVLANI